MKTSLVIDTSTPRTIAAIVAEEEIIWSGFHDGATSHGEALGRLIEDAKNQATFKSINQVVVGMGPGPYTGLRVGIIFAMSFANARQIPWIGVCSLDGIDIDCDSYLVATDARRKEIYWARYQDGIRTQGPSVCAPDEIKDIDIKKFGFGFGDALYPSMALLLAKSKTQDVKQPFYLRRPDAIESSAR